MATTTTTTTTTAPDFGAITARQQQVWASGDYATVAARIPVISELLCDSADLRAGSRVLDVAGGSGNTALAAARCGARVVSLDYVPALLDRAMTRAAAEGLDLEVVEGDAQALPFADGSFDAVVSVVGVMFAPDQRRTAAELLRVCRPGGTIALANWTPTGFIGELFRTIGAHVPPPAGLRSPVLWGTEERLRELFDGEIDELRLEKRHLTFRYRSPAAYIDYWRRYYGPTLKAFENVGEAGRVALERDLLELIAQFNRADDGTMVVPSEYLETVIARR
jgi:SAM-dependent methyltransferase